MQDQICEQVLRAVQRAGTIAKRGKELHHSHAAIVLEVLATGLEYQGKWLDRTIELLGPTLIKAALDIEADVALHCNLDAALLLALSALDDLTDSVDPAERCKAVQVAAGAGAALFNLLAMRRYETLRAVCAEILSHGSMSLQAYEAFVAAHPVSVEHAH